MASPDYFKYFPDIDYAYKIDKAGKNTKIKIKDYFHLMTVREDIFKTDTLYYKYNVVDGMRPEQIAYDVYGNEKYYWVILQVNDIVDYNNEWPLSQYELDQFIDKKYDGDVGGIHHWETQEVLDDDGEVLQHAGLVVPENYVFEYRSGNAFLTSRPGSVSNTEYEYQVNEEKASIYLLQKKYLFNYETEVVDNAQAIDPNSLVSEINIAERYN